jgi:CubicO group peptidase (beta-lactamase class C family)
VLEVGRAGKDVVMGVPITWGLGYCVDAEDVPSAAGSRVAWWAGGGGSMSWVDLDRRMAFGFTPNRWVRGTHEQDRSRRLLAAVYAALAR